MEGALFEEPASVCPECQGHIVYEQVHGEAFCEDCGLVDRMDIIQTDNDHNSNTDGGEPFYAVTPDPPGPLIEPLFSPRGVKGITPELRRVGRTAKYQGLRQNERKAMHFSREVRQLASQFELPYTIANKAIAIDKAFKKAIVEKGLKTKMMILPYIAALLLLACRQDNVAIPLKAMVKAMGSYGNTRTPGSRVPHTVAKVLKYKSQILRVVPEESGNHPPIQSAISTGINLAVGQLVLGTKTEQVRARTLIIAREFVVRYQKAPHPSSVVAAALYLTLGEFGIKLSQKKLTLAAGASEISMRYYSELIQEMGISRRVSSPKIPEIDLDDISA